MNKKLLAVFSLLSSLTLLAACGGEGEKACVHTGGEATCTQKAVCDECGEEYGELAAHDYSVVQSDEDSHWNKCANCDATEGDTAHVAGTEVKYDATNHWNECECGYKMNVTAHTLVGGSDADKHWGECECGYTANEEAHNYSIAKSDENKHWNECICGAKSGEAAHVYSAHTYYGLMMVMGGGEWALVTENGKAFGALAEGKACGYMPAVDVTLNGRTFTSASKVSYTFEQCGPASYYIKTADGKYLIMKDNYNSFNLSDTLPENNGGVWGIDTSEGLAKIINAYSNKWIQYDEQYGTFGAYDTQKGVNVNVFGYGEETVNVKSDDTNHWAECSCGYKKDVEAHVAGTEVQYDATNHWNECECGYKMNVTAHVAGTEVKSDETNHWYECECGYEMNVEAHKGGTASCTEKAECEVCETAYGDLAEHDYTGSIYNKVNAIVSGNKYAIVADKQAAGALYEDKTYGYLYPSTLSAVNGSDANYIEFTFTEVTGGYTIQDKYDRYLYASYNSGKGYWYNSFNVAAELPAEGGVWTVAFAADGTVTITNVASSMYIQYSTQYSSYGAYDTEKGLLPSLYEATSNINKDASEHWFTCIECGEAGEKVAHVAGDVWGSDEDSHWQVCECGATINEAAHSQQDEWTWENKDGYYVGSCVCGKEMQKINLTNGIQTRINLNLETADAETEATFGMLEVINPEILMQGGLELNMVDGEPSFLEYNGQNVMEYLCGVDENEAPVFSAKMFGRDYGVQHLDFLVVTPDGVTQTIELEVLLITNVIETKAELDNFATVAKACEEDANTWGGYFELGDNIVYNDNLAERAGGNSSDLSKIPFKWNSGWAGTDTNGFVGTFDGCGYSIDGLLVYDGGFISKVGEAGVLKNVKFTNALIGSKGNIIAGYNFGTVENVYVHVYAFGVFWGSGSTWASFAHWNPGATGANTAIINGQAWDATGTVDNVFVDMTESAKNMYLESNRDWYQQNWTSYDGNTAIRILGLAGGAAQYKGVYVVGLPNNAEDTDKIKLVHNLTRSDLLNGYADNEAWKAAYSVENSAIAAEIATWPAWLKATALPAETANIAARKVNLNVQYAEGTISKSNDVATLDLSAIGADLGDLISASYKGVNIAEASLSGSTLSVPVAAFGFDYGNAAITVATTNGKWIVPMKLVTKVLMSAKDVQDFVYIADLVGSVTLPNGYYELGQNIDFSTYNGGVFVPNHRLGAAPYYWDTENKWGFAGVFDGCGYTIDSMTVGDGASDTCKYSAFIPQLAPTGIIRNVGFTKASLNMTSLCGYVTFAAAGLIENVYVDLYGTAKNQIGILTGFYNRNTVTVQPIVRDCFTNLLDSTHGAYSNIGVTTQLYALGGNSTYAMVKFEGAYTLVPNEINNIPYIAGDKDFGAAEGSIYGGFTSTDALAADAAAQAEMATWNTAYWTITDGVPVWNTAVANS